MKGGEALLGGQITIEHAPGHTAGHAIFRIASKGETVLHIADLAHHPILMFRDPNWFVGLDHHPKAAVATRKAVFARAAVERTRIFAFHLSYPALGRIAKLGDGYRWLPERALWDKA
jgi:glyoxylase-like metal-dependent hydrolase (beta-lactamase superfamily II)